METKITDHAKKRMREYGISESLLNQTLNKPDNI